MALIRKKNPKIISFQYFKSTKKWNENIALFQLKARSII